MGLKFIDKIKQHKENNMKARQVQEKVTITEAQMEAIKELMHDEFKKELVAWDQKHYRELDALVLWVLHTEFEFGPIRLKRFHHAFVDRINKLIEYYQMDDADDVWLCTRKLKEYGINLDEWDAELQDVQEGEVNGGQSEAEEKNTEDQT